jgi:hypothetical protein
MRREWDSNPRVETDDSLANCSINHSGISPVQQL